MLIEVDVETLAPSVALAVSDVVVEGVMVDATDSTADVNVSIVDVDVVAVVTVDSVATLVSVISLVLVSAVMDIVMLVGTASVMFVLTLCAVESAVAATPDSSIIDVVAADTDASSDADADVSILSVDVDAVMEKYSLMLPSVDSSTDVVVSAVTANASVRSPTSERPVVVLDSTDVAS